MTYKWIGAILVIVGCGSVGFSFAAAYAREERLLRQLLAMFRFMESELQYHLSPLPDLCRQAGNGTNGVLREVMQGFVRELESQISPDAGSCMRVVLSKAEDLPASARSILHTLGQTLGRFDLPGQVQGLQSAEAACTEKLKALEEKREERVRGYQTLGLCAGAALVILFI